MIFLCAFWYDSYLCVDGSEGAYYYLLHFISFFPEHSVEFDISYARSYISTDVK